MIQFLKGFESTTKVLKYNVCVGHIDRRGNFLEENVGEKGILTYEGEKIPLALTTDEKEVVKTYIEATYPAAFQGDWSGIPT